MLPMLSLLVACSTFSRWGDLPPAEGPFRVESPQPGARVGVGPLPVSGVLGSRTEVAVNGRTALIEAGRWHADVALEPGIAVLDVTSRTGGGETRTERMQVLAGDFAPPSIAGAGAVQLRLGPDDLDGIGPLLADLLDPSLLMGPMQGTPILQSPDYDVYLAGIDIPTLAVDAVPRSGFLDLRLAMPGLTIRLDVETQLWIIDIDVDANIRLDEAAIVGQLRLEALPDGSLEIDFANPQLQVSGVEFDIDGLADFFEDMFLTDQQAEALLLDNLAPLEAAIPDLLGSALGGVDPIALETELLGTPLTARIAFARADLSPDGLELVLDLGLDVPSAAGPADSLVVGVPAAAPGLAAQLSDDALNHALHALWSGGALELELPLEPGSLAGVLVELFGGDPAVGGTLRLDPALPPVVVGRDGGLRLQLGECLLTVDTPGGLHGDRVALKMALDAAMDVALGEDAVGAQLTDARVWLSPTEGTPEALDLETLEQTMGLGIGVLNGLLSFPLDGIELGGLELPEVLLTREPSDRATRIELLLTPSP